MTGTGDALIVLTIGAVVAVVGFGRLERWRQGHPTTPGRDDVPAWLGLGCFGIVAIAIATVLVLTGLWHFIGP